MVRENNTEKYIWPSEVFQKYDIEFVQVIPIRIFLKLKTHPSVRHNGVPSRKAKCLLQPIE